MNDSVARGVEPSRRRLGDTVSFVCVNADLVEAAAACLAKVGPAINGAHAAAAAMTADLVPAAGDEISAAIARLFGTYAQNYQGLATQAAAFHDRFVQALNAATGSYVAAETANAAAVFQTAQQAALGAVNAPSEALLGHPLISTGSATPTADSVPILGAGGIIPENAYPYGSIKQLTFTASVDLGVQELDAMLQPYITSHTPITVYGYSQSAVIASLEMAKLQAQGVPTSEISFLIVGDPMNPNGGFFERFAGLSMPGLGWTFYGATPSNAYPTNIYTLQYDSVADFPRYPLDILSDVNAIMSVNHFQYHLLSTGQLDGAIPLPTSGPSMTHYYVIPLDNLPLLDPLRSIPIIGLAASDLVQPDLTYLVNLGYGDPLYGWSTGPADVPTPAGLFPPLSAFQELPGLLASGTQQGVHNFLADFAGSGPHPVTLPSISSVTSLLAHPSNLLAALLDPSGTTSGTLLNSGLYPSSGTASGTTPVTGPATGLPTLPATGFSAFLSNPTALATPLANIGYTASDLASNIYTRLFATADVLNAALISIPLYDVNLFLDGILQAINGQPVMGLVNAVGMPIAADVGLYTWLYGLEDSIIYQPSEAAGPATGIPSIGIG